MNNNLCPCTSGNLYADCCGAIIAQTKVATTPEQLMRSRYSAFALHHEQWLKQSWDPSSRPEKIQFEDGLKWIQLTLIKHSTNTNAGQVEFEARYIKNGKVSAIHENSHFLKHLGQWFYVQGDYLKTTFKPFKIGRNNPCPCHSGLKFKACCDLS